MNRSSEEPKKENASSNVVSNLNTDDVRSDDAIAYDNSLDLAGNEDAEDDVLRALIKKAAEDKAAGRDNGWNSRKKGWDPMGS